MRSDLAGEKSCGFKRLLLYWRFCEVSRYYTVEISVQGKVVLMEAAVKSCHIQYCWVLMFQY